ncbi:MAG: murein biosynthesis integral membrane protein MurJ [Anaerolineaceae bacterium]|nr:MAG: murein biosynthesis integral membrane protein MurJ [Anaerolineaceae bacterium]
MSEKTGALSNAGVLRAAVIVIFGFVASGVLGFVRTGAFSATFGGDSAELDAFYAAQRIPELLFVVVAGGALGSAFIPVFARYLKPESRDEAWRLASAVMTLSMAAAGVMALIVAIFAPVIVPVVLTPGWSAEQQALTVSLTRILLITTVIFAASGLSMGILNAHQSFLFPALAASMYNVGLIVGALIIARVLPAYSLAGDAAAMSTPANIYGLAYGAILGASLHLLVQIPALIKIRARLRPNFNRHTSGAGEVLTLMIPRVLGLAVVQINFIVNVAFASTMVTGSQIALTTAWFLLFFTLGVLGQSVGTAVFPTLSALAAEGDMDGYKARLASAMRGVLFLAIPASVGLILLGESLVSVFERGEWTREHTQATAWALTFFAVGMAGHGLLEILSRAFYALADTWTPVKIGIGAIIGNIILSFIFIQFIGTPGSLTRGPFAGLALANSLTTLIESAVLWWLLRRRIGGLHDAAILRSSGRGILATAVMAAIVLAVVAMLGDAPQMVILFTGAAVGAVSFFVLAILMGMDEVSIITRRLPFLKARVG